MRFIYTAYFSFLLSSISFRGVWAFEYTDIPKIHTHCYSISMDFVYMRIFFCGIVVVVVFIVLNIIIICFFWGYDNKFSCWAHLFHIWAQLYIGLCVHSTCVVVIFVFIIFSQSVRLHYMIRFLSSMCIVCKMDWKHLFPYFRCMRLQVFSSSFDHRVRVSFSPVIHPYTTIHIFVYVSHGMLNVFFFITSLTRCMCVFVCM